ncbi:MAG: trypsin-like serine peptidase [Phycisphaerae bacterium]
MNMRNLLALVIAAGGILTAQAQESMIGIADHRPTALRGVRDWRAATLLSPDTVPAFVWLPDTEPPVEPPAAQPGESRPFSQEIGYTRPFAAQMLPEWPWREHIDGGYVARVELFSKDAVGLRLRFSGLHIIRALELRVYDPGGTDVFGPFISPARLPDKTWWTPTVFGEMIGVELYAPPGSNISVGAPQIIEVAYLNCECAFAPGSPLGCHNDVSCHSSWKNADGRAVARITFVSGGGCGACTGALLNRQPGDLSPLFMTANHCISTSAEADSLEVFWFYETPTCDGTPPDPNSVPRTFGSYVLKRKASADWTLLGLYDPPAGDFYLGWDASDWDDWFATGIHHPRASFKRISFGDEEGPTTRTFCDQNGQNCFDADVWEVLLTDGTTEPGSSGSPIFQTHQGRQVMGTLSGGESGCPELSKYYGRLDLAYANLRYYLGSSYIASPVFVSGDVGGDPGNDGEAERGTSELPFNSVGEATYAVIAGDEVRIKPGNYNEQLTIWRPMTLKRWNVASGVVRIGAP